MRDSTLCLPTQVQSRGIVYWEFLVCQVSFFRLHFKIYQVAVGCNYGSHDKGWKSPEDKYSSAFRLRHFAHNKAMVTRWSRHISKCWKATLLFLELRSDNKKKKDVASLTSTRSFQTTTTGTVTAELFWCLMECFYEGMKYLLKNLSTSKTFKILRQTINKMQRNRHSLIIATLSTVAGLLAVKVNLLTT